jgi:hypothetical protein
MHEGWTEDMRMASRKVFGHGIMCYRSREVENGLTGHPGQTHEGWTKYVKKAEGLCLVMLTSVTGHGNLKMVVPVSGYGNNRDRPKTGKALANMCHLAENTQRTCAISERATTATWKWWYRSPGTETSGTDQRLEKH